MNSPLLGLDIGLKRTGVALSESGIICHPLTVIEAVPPHMHNVISGIVDLVREYSVRTLVIGVPYMEDDDATSQALKVENVIAQLEDALRELPVVPVIERVNEFHSSIDAQEAYPGTPLDSAAAAIILQSYLDERS